MKMHMVDAGNTTVIMDREPNSQHQYEHLHASCLCQVDKKMSVTSNKKHSRMLRNIGMPKKQRKPGLWSQYQGQSSKCIKSRFRVQY